MTLRPLFAMQTNNTICLRKRGHRRQAEPLQRVNRLATRLLDRVGDAQLANLLTVDTNGDRCVVAANRNGVALDDPMNADTRLVSEIRDRGQRAEHSSCSGRDGLRDRMLGSRLDGTLWHSWANERSLSSPQISISMQARLPSATGRPGNADLWPSTSTPLHD